MEAINLERRKSRLGRESPAQREMRGRTALQKALYLNMSHPPLSARAMPIRAAINPPGLNTCKETWCKCGISANISDIRASARILQGRKSRKNWRPGNPKRLGPQYLITNPKAMISNWGRGAMSYLAPAIGQKKVIRCKGRWPDMGRLLLQGHCCRGDRVPGAMPGDRVRRGLHGNF